MTQLCRGNSIYCISIHILFHLGSQNLACISTELKRTLPLFDSQNMDFVLTPCFSEFAGLWVKGAATSGAFTVLKILRKKKCTEPSVYVTWISTQNLNKRKLSQKLISCGRPLLLVVVGTSGSHVPLPHQCPSFFWALGKVWASLERSLEATRDYSHLKFKGPPGKCIVCFLRF